MGRIKQICKRAGASIKNNSLRKSLVIYIFSAVLAAVSSIFFTLQACRGWMDIIYQKYDISPEYTYEGGGTFTLRYYPRHGFAVIVTPQEAVGDLSRKDARLLEVLKNIQLLCIPVYSAASVAIVSLLYYQNKLREPIFLLKTQIQYIRRNDLSFSCRYDSGDEMGEICEAMDRMRLSVLKNQQAVQEMTEEQRQINAAFAHDLRTPLTVISGYAEMLLVYERQGQLGADQTREILSSMQRQVKRIQKFSETMKDIQNFEALEVRRRRHTPEDLERELCRTVKGLEQKNRTSAGEGEEKEAPVFHVAVDSKAVGSADVADVSFLYYDDNLLMEVLGNLLSNAMRYADRQIDILARREGNLLNIYVRDDGRGLTEEELYRADSPYYSDRVQTQDSGVHFGLGLTISKILCKKHGGSLSLSNSVEGGAIVCAQFFVGEY